MKLALGLSLLLNLVLLAVVGSKNSREQVLTPVKTATLPAAPETQRITPTSPRKSPRAARVSPWQGIDSPDPARFMANLRAIGCPEETICNILILRIAREFRSRLLAEEAEAARAWDFTRNRSIEDWEAMNLRQMELRDEMTSVLETLLGESARGAILSMVSWAQPGDDPMASFSNEKRRQVRDIERLYTHKLQKLQRQALSVGDAQPDADLRTLEKERQMELARTLSPQEYAEYRYHRSSAADWVRENAPEAKSEAEFRLMVDLAEQMELVRIGQSLTFASDSDPAVGDARKNREERKAVFHQQLKDLLGEARWQEIQAAEQLRVEQERARERTRSKDGERAAFTALAVSAGVSPEDAMRFMDRIKNSEAELKPKFEQLEKTLTGTPEEKQQQMRAAVRAELEKIATEVMGSKGPAFIEKLTETGRF